MGADQNRWAIGPIRLRALPTTQSVVYPDLGRGSTTGGKQVAARRTTRGARLGGDDGSAVVEAAIVLPVVVLLIFGIVEIGFLFRSATIVSTSSRNGARLASAQYGSQKTLANQNSLMDNVRLTVEKDLTSRAGVDTPVVMWIYKADANGNPPSG